MTKLFLISGLALSAFIASACNGNKVETEGPLSFGEADLGPEGKDLLKDLPEDLSGDKQNARYTNEILRGEDEDGI